MNSNFRKMLLAAAGFVVLSLPAPRGRLDGGDRLAGAQGQFDEADAAGSAPVPTPARSVGFKKSKKKKAKK